LSSKYSVLSKLCEADTAIPEIKLPQFSRNLQIIQTNILGFSFGVIHGHNKT